MILSRKLVVVIALLALQGCGNESGEAEPAKQAPAHAIQPDPGSNHAEYPAAFEDAVRFVYDATQDYAAIHEQKILVEASPPINVRPDRVGFEMKLIPGDSAKGMKPFYLSATEVTAGMFYPWSTGAGLDSDDWLIWALRDLRPSRMQPELLGYGPPRRPALGMSRTVAEFYCEWLRKQTGRNYRLPTEAEWVHALKLGGGVPEDQQTILEYATVQQNAGYSPEPPFLDQSSVVGSRKSDQLGLYDMLGNAAEWVSETGKERVVRGGHFMVDAKDLNEHWRGGEDIAVWNESSPWAALPDQPTYWYRDFYFTGIRLACDADQAPQTPTPDEPDDPDRP